MSAPAGLDIVRASNEEGSAGRALATAASFLLVIVSSLTNGRWNRLGGWLRTETRPVAPFRQSTLLSDSSWQRHGGRRRRYEPHGAARPGPYCRPITRRAYPPAPRNRHR